MKIIAKTIEGKEFIYSATSARKVSERSANKICDIVNQYKFLLDTSKNEKWFIYEIDKYDIAYDYAQVQSFTIRNGIVTARNY